MEINYKELYGVLPEESDFSGAIERSLEEGIQHLDKGEFLKYINEWENEHYKWVAERKLKDQKLQEELKEYFEKNPQAKKDYEDAKKRNREAEGLILEYNRRMKDDENYPDKDAVRRWYFFMCDKFIEKGYHSYQFLYPDFITSAE